MPFLAAILFLALVPAFRPIASTDIAFDNLMQACGSAQPEEIEPILDSYLAQDKKAVTKLVNALEDNDPFVQRQIPYLLTHLGVPAEKSLLKKLRSEDRRTKAVHALAWLLMSDAGTGKLTARRFLKTKKDSYIASRLGWALCLAKRDMSSQVRQGLKSDDPFVQRWSSAILSRHDHSKDLGTLQALLRSSNPKVVESAASEVVRRGLKGAPWTSLLRNALETKGVSHYSLSWALLRADGDLSDVLAPQASAIKDHSTRSLVLQSPEVSRTELLEVLIGTSIDSGIRAQAAKVLARRGGVTKQHTLQIATLIEDADSQLALGAAQVLQASIDWQEGVSAYVVAALDRSEPWVVSRAALLCARMSRNKNLLRPKLRGLVSDDRAKYFQSEAALFTIGQFSPDSQDELSKLEVFLTHEDLWVQGAAIKAIGNCSEPLRAKACAMILKTQLPAPEAKGPEGDTRWNRSRKEREAMLRDFKEKPGGPILRSVEDALRSLGNTGQNAFAKQLLDSPDMLNAVSLLWSILGNPATMRPELLTPLLESKKPDLRVNAAWALALAGQTTPEHLEAIAGEIPHNSDAVVALRPFGKLAAEHASTLMKALRDETESVNPFLAIETLGYIASGDSKVLTFLSGVLKRSKDDSLKTACATSLFRMGSDALPTLPILIRQCSSESKYLRMMSLRAIHEIAPEDPRTIAAWEKAVGPNTLAQLASLKFMQTRELSMGPAYQGATLVAGMNTSSHKDRLSAYVARQGGMSNAAAGLADDLVFSTDETVRLTICEALLNSSQAGTASIPALAWVLSPSPPTCEAFLEPRVYGVPAAALNTMKLPARIHLASSAIKAITGFGDWARPASPQLKIAANSDQAEVSKAARELLRTLEEE
ncbi:MAG: hypothetical protein GY930_14670 [bacterium]|nr:hypothetical protein [bacterium]